MNVLRESPRTCILEWEWKVGQGLARMGADVIVPYHKGDHLPVLGHLHFGILPHGPHKSLGLIQHQIGLGSRDGQVEGFPLSVCVCVNFYSWRRCLAIQKSYLVIYRAFRSIS
jgi:hypothetical protein